MRHNNHGTDVFQVEEQFFDFRRADWVDSFMKLANWEFAAQRLAAVWESKCEK